MLRPGATRLVLALNDLSRDDARFLDVRFGNVMPAMPLPTAAALRIGGIGALARIRRRRSG